MTFQTTAILLAWVAIVILGFAMAGLAPHREPADPAGDRWTPYQQHQSGVGVAEVVEPDVGEARADERHRPELDRAVEGEVREPVDDAHPDQPQDRGDARGHRRWAGPGIGRA